MFMRSLSFKRRYHIQDIVHKKQARHNKVCTESYEFALTQMTQLLPQRRKSQSKEKEWRSRENV